MIDHANQQKMLAKHHADVIGAMAEGIARRHDVVRSALAELVALKDQKEAAEKEAEEARKIGACPSVKVQRALHDYEERKPAAWAAARAALGPNAIGQGSAACGASPAPEGSTT